MGKGHIERLPSGSYRVRVYAGNDPLTGKEIRLKATAKTAEHAQAELARLLEQASVGRQPESAATVGYLLDQYMAVADLDVSTREGYEGYIRRTIKPALGGMELRKLRGPVLDTFYAGATASNPDWTSHRVAVIASRAGVSMNVKSLRHYTATQLLSGGIDLWNTAARLGHGAVYLSDLTAAARLAPT